MSLKIDSDIALERLDEFKREVKELRDKERLESGDTDRLRERVKDFVRAAFSDSKEKLRPLNSDTWVAPGTEARWQDFYQTKLSKIETVIEVCRESAELEANISGSSSSKAKERGKRAGEHDAFICHAGEDKEEFVRPLAEELDSRGLDVWFDDFTLEIGDNLREEIDRGLRNSRYGIVVLSESFFGKSWPERELRGLTERELAGRKIILPVWYGVDVDDVRDYSPPLAGKKAATASSSEDVEIVASDLYSVISGD